MVDINRHYKNVEQIVGEIIGGVKKGECTSVIGYGDFISDVLKGVFKYGQNINIALIDFNIFDYDNIYAFALNEENDIFIEKLVNENGNYICVDDDVVLVSDRCPLSYIEFLDNKKVAFEVFELCDDKPCSECDEYCNEYNKTCSNLTCECSDACYEGCEYCEDIEIPAVAIYGNLYFGDTVINYNN